jgi:hypothetical protein
MLEQEPTGSNNLSSGTRKNSKKLEKGNCESCRYYGLHHEVCNYCYKCSLWTEKAPTAKNDLAVDAISRADVLKLMKDNWHTHNGDWAMQESMDDIRALPSVTPQEPILDKVRAEIESKLDNINRLYNQDNQYDDGAIDSLQYALDIIDKYSECEGKK